MSGSTEVRDLQAEIRALEEKLHAEGRATQRVQRTSLVVAAVLGVVLLTFLLINYVRIRSELTAEKFTRSIEKELQEVGPVAIKEISRLGEDLMPVYFAEWKSQLQAAWPDISSKMETELLTLGSNITTRINQHFTESENRILESTEQVLGENFPELKDPKKLAELDRRLHATCDQALEKVLLHFDRQFAGDVAQLQEEIFRFDVSDKGETPIDLQKKFLHLWLQLLDQEIMRI